MKESIANKILKVIDTTFLLISSVVIVVVSLSATYIALVYNWSLKDILIYGIGVDGTMLGLIGLGIVLDRTLRLRGIEQDIKRIDSSLKNGMGGKDFTSYRDMEIALPSQISDTEYHLRYLLMNTCSKLPPNHAEEIANHLINMRRSGIQIKCDLVIAADYKSLSASSQVKFKEDIEACFKVFSDRGLQKLVTIYMLEVIPSGLDIFIYDRRQYIVALMPDQGVLQWGRLFNDHVLAERMSDWFDEYIVKHSKLFDEWKVAHP